MHLPFRGSRLPIRYKCKQLTPQMGDNTIGIHQQYTMIESSLSKYTETNYTRYSTPKHICVSVRLILPYTKWSRFRNENESKSSKKCLWEI